MISDIFYFADFIFTLLTFKIYRYEKINGKHFTNLGKLAEEEKASNEKKEFISRTRNPVYFIRWRIY
jgi:hypothetical protein